MKRKQDELNPLLNIASGLTAILIALLLEYKPSFLFQPALRNILLPVVNITLSDAILYYLAIFVYLGGVMALGITMTNLPVKLRAAVLCYFGGWAFGWYWHLIRFWLRLGHW